VELQIPIVPLNRDSFRPYGRIIEYPNQEKKGKTKNLWRIVWKEDKPSGWRIAYLVVRDQSIRRLERHPQSDESFEPVKGKSVFLVSRQKNPKSIKGFVLNKPLVLKKNIWHGLITLSDETEIKITENLYVKCQFWPFEHKITKASLCRSGSTRL
jgi:ureidoglycolate hydrolase